MIRQIVLKDHDPNASVPDFIVRNVRDPDYSEAWTEGLSVYHNPRATHQIEMEWFPNAAHHFLQEDGNIVSYVPEYFPMGGITAFTHVDDRKEAG
jgi:hypothetical protein